MPEEMSGICRIAGVSTSAIGRLCHIHFTADVYARNRIDGFIERSEHASSNCRRRVSATARSVMAAASPIT